MTADRARAPRPGLLDRADRLVGCLEVRGEASVAEIAAAIGEPVSSTYRLIGALVGGGWVDPGPQRGRYRLGLWFMRVGALAEERIDLRSEALPFLAALRAETGLSVILCIRRGARAVCVERVDGEEVDPLAMRLGDNAPLPSGAAPRALFAFLPRSEREAVLAELATADIDDVAAERARGWTLADFSATRGVIGVGAPIFNHRGEVEGSIGASGLRERVVAGGSGLTEAVVATAARISAALGFEGAGR